MFLAMTEVQCTRTITLPCSVFVLLIFIEQLCSVRRHICFNETCLVMTLIFRFYNSRLDLASNIRAGCKKGTNLTECYNTVSEQATNLTAVANLLAKFLYTLATGDNSTENVTVDVDTVSYIDHITDIFYVNSYFTHY